MAFLGRFDYSLDAKNRLTVPARFRASLSEGVVLAKGTAPCTAIWTPAAFSAYVEQAVEGMHPLSPEREQIVRFLTSSAFEVGLDAAGRVMVPPDLLAYAGLTKEVTIVGVDIRLEVWDRGRWAEQQEHVDIAKLTARFGTQAGH
jgi:MraZ protein